MILIDGHNMLFQVDMVEGAIEKNIEKLILKIQKQLDLMLKKAIVVFDGKGGRGEHGYEYLYSTQLRVIYSGDHVSADDWIVNWIYRHKGLECEVITCDKRMLQRLPKKSVKNQRCKPWLNQARVDQPISKKEFGSEDEWLAYFGETNE